MENDASINPFDVPHHVMFFIQVEANFMQGQPAVLEYPDLYACSKLAP
jgi:hypothetical protein